MLAELHIEDLGVIDRLDLVVGPGLVVVTGETGAGKTMIVEALELLVGGRADTGCVRPGASEARVEGRFVVGDDEWVLARVIPIDGRSRAYVNGRLATVAQLAEIGTQLVDIHGQHAHQGLLTTAVQRAALDTFAGTDLAPLREARARLTEIDAAMASLGGDQRARAREIDLLRFQVQEIDGAGVASPDEDVACEREEDVLADASAHREAADVAHELLTGDGAAIDRVAAALGALGSRSPFSELAARLRGASAELADIARDIRSIGEDCLDDPE
ncbi:MAG: repair protein RecN, partial [Actinomycetota bacterium]